MTRYLLRGAYGYVSGIAEGPDWTANADQAFQWMSSESAHRARRAWLDNGGGHLTVVVRDGQRLTPFGALCYPTRSTR